MKKRLAEALVFHFSYFPFKKWGTGSVRDIKGAEGGPGSLYSLFHLHKSFPYLTPSDWLALSFKCPSALCGFPRTTVKWSLLLRIISSICCESLAVCSEGKPTWWWLGATRKGRVPATRVPTSSSSSWNIDAPFLSLLLSLSSQMTLCLSLLTYLCIRRKAKHLVHVLLKLGFFFLKQKYKRILTERWRLAYIWWCHGNKKICLIKLMKNRVS